MASRILSETNPTAEAAPVPPLRWWRSMILGFLLMPWCAYWAADQSIDVIFSLLVPPTFCMMVLAFLNLFLRKRLPQLTISGGELMLVYSFLSCGCAVAAEWMLINNQYLHSYAIFQDRDPLFQRILPHLPEWLYFKDASLLQDYAIGGYDLWYFFGKLGLWGKLIAAWVLLFFLLTLVMICINTLMRELWVKRERLAFPIIQVPLLLAQPESPSWKNRYLWGAFAVMFAIDMLNGFQFLYPSLPRVNVRFLMNANDFLPNAPWNAIGWTPVGIFPYMSAIGIFMPTDLLFSCVFFFFLRKAMQVLVASWGYEQGVFGGGWLVPSPPYFSEQTWGAFLGLFVTAMWAGRGYLRELWRHIVHDTNPDKDSIAPRWAFVGLVASMVGLGLFGMAVGLPFLLVIAYLGVFYMFSIALTRMRAQLGPPSHEMAFMGPNQLLADVSLMQQMSETQITRLANLFLVTNRIHRSHPMPYSLEAYKMGEVLKVGGKVIFWVVIAGTLAGIVFGQMAHIYRGYMQGAPPNWYDAPASVREFVDNRRPINIAAIAALLSAFTSVLVMDFIRFRVPGFPLHPAGYALSMNFGVDYFWFGLIIALTVKIFVQRYYGLKGYQQLRLVAVGIILAEFLAEGFWSTWSILDQTATYSISINGRLGWQQ